MGAAGASSRAFPHRSRRMDYPVSSIKKTIVSARDYQLNINFHIVVRFSHNSHEMLKDLFRTSNFFSIRNQLSSKAFSTSR